MTYATELQRLVAAHVAQQIVRGSRKKFSSLHSEALGAIMFQHQNRPGHIEHPLTDAEKVSNLAEKLAELERRIAALENK